MYSRGKVFVVSGPSGAGKTTIVNLFLERYGDQFNIKRVVSYTTRFKRYGEKDGVDYHFVDSQWFDKKLKENFFIESASWGGHQYGMARDIEDGLRDGCSYIAVIDRDGARKLMELLDDLVLIWITVPNLSVLKDRLKKRSGEEKEDIAKRLLISGQEIEKEKENPMYSYYIENVDLTAAVSRFLDIVRGCLTGVNKRALKK